MGLAIAICLKNLYNRCISAKVIQRNLLGKEVNSDAILTERKRSGNGGVCFDPCVNRYCSYHYSHPSRRPSFNGLQFHHISFVKDFSRKLFSFKGPWYIQGSLLYSFFRFDIYCYFNGIKKMSKEIL